MLKIALHGGLALAAACGVGGCGDGETASADGNSVQYSRLPITVDQSAGLTRLSVSRMSQGKVPEDVGMVVSPQPADVPEGKLLVAVQYGSCGHALGRARLDERVLVIEKTEPSGDSDVCLGRIEMTGLLVATKAKVESVRVESAK